MDDPRLSAYLEKLRSHFPGREFPGFDPLDGGANGRLLIVLQNPKTDRRGPLRFNPRKIAKVSRDNGDPTPDHVRDYFAMLPRTEQIMWNAIPYFLREGEMPSGGHINVCAPWLLILMRDYLPKLRGGLVLREGRNLQGT